jgi:6-phosphogluconate dehydrogenase (decarboxylating)
MMPGGEPEAYKHLQPIVEKVAAQTDDGPCVTYIGKGGSGNYVKMVHNGIEYGDMQLIAEAYDVLRVVGGLTNEELAAVFDEWNKVRGWVGGGRGGETGVDWGGRQRWLPRLVLSRGRRCGELWPC